jgi:hypothetical protein
MNPDTVIAPRTKRAALYVRVSTTNRAARNQAVFEQNPEVQELPLRQMAEQRGWTVVRVYSDRMSGSKSDRPGLNALMRDARRGAFDVVVVWRFDRFARSIEQLVLALAEFARSESISYLPRKRWTPAHQWARPCSQSSAQWLSWSATSFASG